MPEQVKTKPQTTERSSQISVFFLKRGAFSPPAPPAAGPPVRPAARRSPQIPANSPGVASLQLSRADRAESARGRPSTKPGPRVRPAGAPRRRPPSARGGAGSSARAPGWATRPAETFGPGPRPGSQTPAKCKQSRRRPAASPNAPHTETLQNAPIPCHVPPSKMQKFFCISNASSFRFSKKGEKNVPWRKTLPRP